MRMIVSCADSVFHIQCRLTYRIWDAAFAATGVLGQIDVMCEQSDGM